MASNRGKPQSGQRPVRTLAQTATAPARGRSSPRRPVRRRVGRRRRWLLPVGSLGLVLATAITLVAVSLSSGGATASEAAAPAKVVGQVTNLPLSLLSRIGAGQSATSLQPVRSGSPLSLSGKPGIVFVSEESCPFCAAERWPLVIALSHFGTWKHLGATSSSSMDVFPSTATFSFRDATYSSALLTLRTTELTDNTGHPLQAPSTLDTALIDRYDVPPYVNSSSQSGAVPFLDIANHDVLAGSQYDPQVLAGLSMSEIGAQLDDPASPVAQAVDRSASLLIAAIDQVVHPAHNRA